LRKFLFTFRKSRFLRSDRAQSLVEISLVLPLLVFGLLGGADLARAFAVQLAVQNGARAGAESYAIDSTPTPFEAQTAAVNEMNRTPTIGATIGNVSVVEAQSDGVTACIYPPTALTRCYVTVRVTYTWRAVTNWPWIPNTANFDRTTIFQMFYR
jgi:Flp pilus assembly protein TadG